MFAKRLFQMPAGAISTERIWSIYSFIHSKIRNRLNSDSLQKLAFVYTNSALIDEDKNDYYEENDFFGIAED